MATQLTVDWNTDATLDTTIPKAQLGASGLTGYTFDFYAKKALTDADAAAFIHKSATATQVGSTTVDGVVSTTLLAADTASLPRYTVVLVWRLVATDAGGKKTVPDEGTLIVRVG